MNCIRRVRAAIAGERAQGSATAKAQGSNQPHSIAPIIFLSAASILRADAAGDPTQFEERVPSLRRRVSELVDENNLLDTLYFAWSDRPYARATLAIVIKVAHTLDREMEARRQGTAKIDNATLESMVGWAEKAVRRVVNAHPNPGFRPHRVRIDKDAILAEPSPLRLYAFAGEAEDRSNGKVVRDLDLLASLGQRVYPRFTRDVNSEGARLIASRALALGMQVVVPASGDDEAPSLRSVPVTADLRIESNGTGNRNLGASRDLSAFRDGFALHQPFLREPSHKETLACGIARRALLRGVLATEVFSMVESAPPICPPPRVVAEPRKLRAAMWVHALQGQRLAILRGWNDPSDDRWSSPPCTVLEPFLVETIAHTALDLLRLAPYFLAFSGKPILAIEIGEDAGFDSLQTDGWDSWAPWAASVWDGIVSRQVWFDVVPRTEGDDRFRRRYSVVIPLERPTDGRTGVLMEKIERRLVQIEEHVYRLTARERDGTIARDMYVRTGTTPEGKACAAIVNLKDRQRVLKLRGKPAIGPSRDVVADQPIPEPGQSLEFAPWQVRLLWPVD